MEQWALLSHGAAYVTHDAMCYRSDRFVNIYCTKCGDQARAERVEGIGFKCLACGAAGTSEELFGRAEMSYAFVNMNHHLHAMGLGAVHQFSKAQPID